MGACDWRGEAVRGGAASAFRLEDLIDIPQFQLLQDRLNKVYSFPSAIIDNDGKVLTATAWQDVCTKFHRAHPATAAACVESDKYILSHIHEANPAVTYRCPHGLIDNATPIVIDGVHYGNFFTGQFFLEKPDPAFFERQAERHGFDRAAYLAAVRKVPVWSQDQLDNYLFFIKGLIEVISTAGLKKLREIEARRQVEASEDRARIILAQISDGYWVVDRDGRIRDVNDALCRMLDRSREDLLRLSLCDVSALDSWALAERMQEVARLGLAAFEMELRARDGATIHTEVVARCLPDQEGMIGFHRDITDRKKAEQQLRASQATLCGVLNAVPQSIFWKDREGVYLGCNEPFARAVGLEHPDQIVGKTDFDLPWPRSEAEAYRADDAEVVRRGGVKRHIIEPLQQADGTRLRIDTTKVPLLDAAGRPHGVLGIYDDVTERLNAEAALKARERQLAESQRIAHVGSWEHNLKTGAVLWSDELFRLLGLDPRRDPADFGLFFSRVHPDDQPALRRAIDTTLAERIPFDIEYRFVLGDGRTRVIHAQAELLDDEVGDPVVLSGTAQDITARREASERLRQSEQFVRGILNTVDEGFIVVDDGYRILTANSAYCRQVGCSGAEEVVGRRCHEVSHRIARPCHEQGEECPVRRVFATGRQSSALHRHESPQGGVLFVETKAYPIKDSSGKVVSVIETINNITERHLLEEERLKTQKLNSIGTLAGGIAHDFNNLLQGIFGYISMARLSRERPERLDTMLRQAEEALHLAVNLTTQLLTFSKGGKPVRNVIRIEPVLENAVKFALSGSCTGYELEIAPDLWAVDADAGQLAQVIQNIVLNANEAMAGRGTVSISVANADLAKGAVPGLPGGGRYVRIVISDTGIGIGEAELERIFDPYFTTKQRGSGLGLATSYSIIRNHGGAVDVASKVGQGSTFTIHLPAAPDAAAAAPPPPPPAPARRGRILLMDDEPLVRNVAQEMMEALGHDVLCVGDGEAAIECYRQARDAGSPFDVVILDLTVRGGMGGEEAIGRLRQIDPAVAAVVSSGYADSAVVADFAAHGFSALLNKPYRIDSLKGCLNDLLGRGARGRAASPGPSRRECTPGP